MLLLLFWPHISNDICIIAKRKLSMSPIVIAYIKTGLQCQGGRKRVKSRLKYVPATSCLLEVLPPSYQRLPISDDTKVIVGVSLFWEISNDNEFVVADADADLLAMNLGSLLKFWLLKAKFLVVRLVLDKMSHFSILFVLSLYILYILHSSIKC